MSKIRSDTTRTPTVIYREREMSCLFVLSVILKLTGRQTMPKFDPEFIILMRNALEEVMTRVPVGYTTTEVKVRLAEIILKSAAQGQTSYDGLVASAAAQIQAIISLIS
jgi:hypothetical protein